jgi:ribosomal protein S18 acetylase RimI-like enzyme
LDSKNGSIEQITPILTLKIRQAELYPNLTLKEVQLDEDEEGLHFGYFHENKLISVVSCFEKDDKSMQFRKFATLKEYQHKGFGTALLKYVLAFAEEQKTKRIWCNARTTAIGFYQKLGLKETDIKFYKDGNDYVIMEKEL